MAAANHLRQPVFMALLESGRAIYIHTVKEDKHGLSTPNTVDEL
jgi:hypothetical protein